MLPDRVAALIIKDKRLLLVTGYKELLYWTPGGKIEGTESHETCLKRELNDELGIKLNSMKHYVTLTLINETKNEKQKSHYYLVEYKGEIKPAQEITKFTWYSKQNFINRNPRLSKGVESELIPKLIKDNYL